MKIPTTRAPQVERPRQLLETPSTSGPEEGEPTELENRRRDLERRRALTERRHPQQAR